MKVIFDYANQIRAYGQSKGHCLVKLERGETVEDVAKQYKINQPKQWFETRYSNLRTLTTYKVGNEIIRGRLVLMDTEHDYLD